jgi:hypothetical protein
MAIGNNRNASERDSRKQHHHVPRGTSTISARAPAARQAACTAGTALTRSNTEMRCTIFTTSYKAGQTPKKRERQRVSDMEMAQGEMNKTAIQSNSHRPSATTRSSQREQRAYRQLGGIAFDGRADGCPTSMRKCQQCMCGNSFSGIIDKPERARRVRDGERQVDSDGSGIIAGAQH